MKNYRDGECVHAVSLVVNRRASGANDVERLKVQAEEANICGIMTVFLQIA